MLGSRPTPRKRWNLHDGPRGSLQRLRSQLAEDGCPESQLHLARSLLDERCELEADRLANFQQAMEWLICATDQGHKEARRMLRRCVHSGVLTSQTTVMTRAKSCLASTLQETVARKAARDLFASLSNGQEFITSAQLEKKMKDLWDMSRTKDDDSSSGEETENSEKDLPENNPNEEELDDNPALEASDNTLSENHNNILTSDKNDELQEDDQPSIDEERVQNISEENLVTAAVTYCQGHLPLVSQALTLTDPNIRALDRIPFMHRAFLHPIIFLQIIYLKILSYFSTLSFQLTPLQILLLFFGHSILGTENIVLYFPLIFYYLSFVFMIVSTFKMLHSKREYVDFRKWSGLFLRYSEGNLNSNESEQQFVKNNLRPFIHFFIALFVHLSLYPLVASQWIPLSEFTMIAFVLTFFMLFTFATNNSYSRFPDFLSFLSFGINVLAKYPYENDTVVSQGWRFLDLQIQTFPSYVIGNGLELCLNSRVLFYMMIPGILLIMSHRERWHGTYKYAIPHCVVLSWLQIFIINSQGATMYGLVRGTLALVGTFLFLPIMGVATVFVPVFAVVKMITVTDVLYMTGLSVGVVLVLALTCILAANKTVQKYITFIQILAAISGLLYLFLPQVHQFHYDNMSQSENEFELSSRDESDEYLKYDTNKFLEEAENYHLLWEEYQTYCHSTAWDKANVASTQMKCSLLNDVKVNWLGYVVDVRITRVDNPWIYFANKLPSFLNELFQCYFGEEYIFNCDNKKGEALRNCRFFEHIAQRENKKCHLNKHNYYEHEVTIRMESGLLLKKGAEIILRASHHFTNFTQKIRTNDKIGFKGVLEPHDAMASRNLKTSHPIINVHELVCLGCQSYDLKAVKLPIKSSNTKTSFATFYKTFVNDVYISVKYILNFVFNPIVIFK